MECARYSRDAILPPGAPLAMPRQQFDCSIVRDTAETSRHAWIARAALALATTTTTLAFSWELYRVLSPNGVTPFQVLFLVFATTAFAWISLGTLNSVLGFFYLRARPPGDTICRQEETTPPSKRVALLFPVFKEDPALIAGTIEALSDELVELKCQQAFDVFVLSDTPHAAAEPKSNHERKLFSDLRRRVARKTNVFYRRRAKNTAKKAGNIQDWVEQFGSRYESFIILDADSIMSAHTLVTLATTMEQRPKAGLIQTVPKLTGAGTLLQYLQQYATNIYGPAAATGLAVWHGSHGNYWGHNAIIRTKAFAGAAGLPSLPGKAPFGGHIQSHDFVEAALLQRAGWEVLMVPTASGSFEGAPPALSDLVTRDRRWAQGNLQHINIAFARGLTPMGRTHLIFGAASYLVSLVWAASLVMGLVLALQGGQMIPSYFADKKTLFPIWPVTDPGPSLQLFVATMVIVLLPKALGATLELRRVQYARETGGTIRTLAAVVTETVFSMLIAPILMITQSRAVLEILSGRDSGWNAQSRDGRDVSIGHAFKLFWLPTVIGAGMATTCLCVSIELTAWMSPILIGTVFSGPIAWFTSKPASDVLRHVLETPEARCEPSIVARTQQMRASWATKNKAPTDKNERSPDNDAVVEIPDAA